MRQYGFHTLFQSEIDKIYNDEYDFDAPHVDYEYWFKAEFVLPVATLFYGVNFGTYNLRTGSTTIFEITNDDHLFHKRGYNEIHATDNDCNMIVYNGTNHFYYLKQY